MIAATLAAILAITLVGTTTGGVQNSRVLSDCVTLDIHAALRDPAPVEDACDEALKLPGLTADQRAGSLLIRGMARLIDGRPRSALSDLDHAFALSDSDPLSLLAIGQIFESLQAYDRALVIYNWILRKRPDHDDLLQRRALLLDRIEHPPAAP